MNKEREEVYVHMYNVYSCKHDCRCMLLSFIWGGGGAFI